MAHRKQAHGLPAKLHHHGLGAVDVGPFRARGRNGAASDGDRSSDLVRNAG